MSAMQAAPIPPQTFDSTQGQIDGLLAAVTALINLIPEESKPALREALAGHQVASRESALHRAEYSDEYFYGHDWICGATWRLGNLGTPPVEFR